MFTFNAYESNIKRLQGKQWLLCDIFLSLIGLWDGEFLNVLSIIDDENINMSTCLDATIEKIYGLRIVLKHETIIEISKDQVIM